MSEAEAQEVEEENEIIQEDNVTHGSSVGGVVFNFTNSIIGAGAIGLGGAIASSGGLVSVVAIIFFATLTKISLDMVIDLSIGSSYEELGRKCYGILGWSAVLISKMFYAFGCLVAYIVVVKDNFSSALGHLCGVVLNDILITVLLSTFVMLPLCLLRDMTPLSNLSMISVLSMGLIVGIVIYLYFDDNIRQDGDTVYVDWLEIRPGLVENLGTFVFSFVSQHTVHLAFDSLRPELQTVQNWKRISSWSIGLSCFVSLSVGVFVYMTFWQHAGSDLFDQYPAIPVIDVAKLLLCSTMLLTFPFPFFTCRDMIVVAATAMAGKKSRASEDLVPETNDLEEPLLPETEEEDDGEPDVEATETITDEVEQQLEITADAQMPSWLLADRQLQLPQHVIITLLLWAVTTTLAIVAPNLGDVLNIVGCATGTVIAFILPALFSFQVNGYSHTAMLILIVGGIVGMVGTFFSTKQLITDATMR